jgi:citrate lyase beta subunit
MDYQRTLDEEFCRTVFQNLNDENIGEVHRPLVCQPVHTVYGGAHLFKAETFQKLNAIAKVNFGRYIADASELAEAFEIDFALATKIFPRVFAKLVSGAIEDYRIDFEDGYGYRADDEEDSHAINAAIETRRAMQQNLLPPFFGIRVKSFSREAKFRSVRTLDLYVTKLAELSGGKLPDNFVITLPKVTSVDEIKVFVEFLTALESRLGLNVNALGLEFLLETTSAFFNANGEFRLPKLLDAAQGRCQSIHFGAYDYTANLGIAAHHQDIRHPACEMARQLMLIAYADKNVRLVDGVTTTLPIEKFKHSHELTPEQLSENRRIIFRAWKLHFDNIQHSMKCGFYQSWDLHPAQFIPRYVATYAFFLSSIDTAAARLQNFIQKAAQASLVGDVFDDMASGLGLMNFFVRAINCGAITEEEAVKYSSVSLEQLISPTTSSSTFADQTKTEVRY